MMGVFGDRVTITSSLLAVGMLFAASAQAAKLEKSSKKKGPAKGGLFNPAQRSQDLALA